MFLSQPLTYTPPGRGQVVIAMSESNNVYVLDAATGSIITSRYLGTPFTAVDAQCADISPTIGITSTPVIDPGSNTLYFWSKGYAAGTTSGLDNGRYLCEPRLAVLMGRCEWACVLILHYSLRRGSGDAPGQIPASRPPGSTGG